MQELFRTLARVAPSNATVLLEGETGTGKELVAKAIAVSTYSILFIIIPRLRPSRPGPRTF